MLNLLLTIIPLALSICLTTVFYIKSIILLRKNSSPFFNNSSLTPKNLYVYCFAHLLTAGPGTIYFISILIHNQAPNEFLLFANFTLGLTGFVNSLIYFFQRKASEEPTEIMTSPLDDDDDSRFSEAIKRTLTKGLNADNYNKT